MWQRLQHPCSTRILCARACYATFLQQPFDFCKRATRCNLLTASFNNLLTTESFHVPKKCLTNLWSKNIVQQPSSQFCNKVVKEHPRRLWYRHVPSECHANMIEKLLYLNTPWQVLQSGASSFRTAIHSRLQLRWYFPQHFVEGHHFYFDEFNFSRLLCRDRS